VHVDTDTKKETGIGREAGREGEREREKTQTKRKKEKPGKTKGE